MMCVNRVETYFMLHLRIQQVPASRCQQATESRTQTITRRSQNAVGAYFMHDSCGASHLTDSAKVQTTRWLLHADIIIAIRSNAGDKKKTNVITVRPTQGQRKNQH